MDMTRNRRLSIAAGERWKEKEYWLNQLSGEWEKSIFPRDDWYRPLGKNQKNKYSRRIPGELFERLARMSKQSDHTLHIILHTALVALLSKYSGNDDVVVGTPIYKQANETGYINSILAIRSRVDGDITFKNLLLQVRQTIIEAIENRNYPIEILAQDLNRPILETGDFSLFDAAIVLENIHDKKYFQGIRFNILFSFSLFPGGIDMGVEFNSSVYDNAGVERIALHFITLLHGILFNVDSPISGISMLPEEEKLRLLKEFNSTAAEYPRDKSIPQLFAEQVAKTPDHIALIGPFGPVRPVRPVRYVQMTYVQLNGQSNRLAELLIEKGVMPDTIVAIMTARSVEMIIGIMGILKSGGAYLPIDPEYPQERIDYMLKDSNAAVLLTDNSQLSIVNCQLSISGCPRRGLNGCPRRGLQHSAFSIQNSNLIYVIYTSGSTGKPKGVMIEHVAVHNFIQGMMRCISFKPGKKILALTTISFDIFGLEVLLPLCQGLEIVMADEEHQRDIRLLKQLILKSGVEMIQATPTRMQMLIESESENENSFLENLKEIMIGGEALPFKLNLALGQLTTANIFNMYGPTETTIWSTVKKLSGTESITIGKPIINTQIYILNKYLEMQPIGIPGEMYIGGDGAARGYLNHPELTAERFLKSRKYRSYGSYRTYILYKTGDLATWLPNGDIQFRGRIDNQVKIRGFRIELGEIESNLSKHKEIKEVVVTSGLSETGDNYLCAYIILYNEQSISISGLREYLGERLPDYMVPAYFIYLDRIPLTPSGKIDRGALPKPGLKVAGTYTAPANEIERKLVELWAEILAVDPLHVSQLQTSIGIGDNFFQLGGHSLKATILLARIQQVFDVKVTLSEMFRMPRIKELAEYIKGKSKDIYISIEPAENKEYYLLSSAQKRLYILQQMGLDSAAYNMPGIIPLPADSDLEKINESFKKLIKRHESLRTSFHMINDTPVQKIHDHVNFQIEQLAKVFGPTFFQKGGFIRPFDLSNAPLLRAGLAKNSDGNYNLLVDMHHIISDGISHEILAMDFNRFYRNQELPALRLAYKDYSEWQAHLEQIGAIKKQEDYWLSEFSGEIPLLDMPLDYARTGDMDFQGNSICFEIDGTLTAKIKKCADQFDITLMMFLFAIYNILLAACACKEEVIVGTVSAGRRHVDLQNIIGFFVNMLAIKTFPGKAKTFSQYLPEVKIKTLNAFENQEYPFDELVSKLGIQREPGRHPFVDMVFVFRDDNTYGEEIGRQASEEPLLNPMNISHFDLMLHASDRGETISVVIEYSTALFKQASIEGFARVYLEILEQVLANNNTRLADIQISHDFLMAKSDLIQGDTGDWEL